MTKIKIFLIKHGISFDAEGPWLEFLEIFVMNR